MRKLASWVDAFVAFTVNTPSPEIYRKWAGIAAVSSAVEQKVWLFTHGEKLFPNMYIFLVGPPGIGKTFAANRARDFITQLPNHMTAPSSVSRASLADALKDAERTAANIVGPNPITLHFNTLTIIINELGTFISTYENDFLATLTDLYDCRPYSERKRTRDVEYAITNPQLNILAGATPSYLAQLFPVGAWEQGFLSRCLLIYSDLHHKQDPFVSVGVDKVAEADLLHDLKMIGEKLIGQIQVTPEARDALWAWIRADRVPIPEHPRLLHYNTRRTAHLLKLCLVASVSRGNDLWITLTDYNVALGWLLEAEHVMPEIFKAMSQSTDYELMRDCWYMALKEYRRTGQPLSEARLMAHIGRSAPAFAVKSILNLMIASHQIKETVSTKNAGRMFVPVDEESDEPIH